ncbi:MAG TPA: hypothetical protein VNB06_02780 [Thermoanaerobaculia bacterium]|nr:hypothetical protein [Thermoanaerobaculia bacterium]
MKLRIVWPVLIAGALLGRAADADTIRLRNGNSLQGVARVLPNGDVAVHSAMGVWTVKASRVLEVVRSETVEERVAEALARTPPPGPQELFELALEVREEGSITLSLRLLERVVSIEPDHEGARRLLGQRRLDDRWVSEQEYRSARGEVLYRGQWVSSATAASALDLEAIDVMRERELVQRRFEQARLELLYQERDLRLQELERERTSYGFPLDRFYGFGGVLVYPTHPVVRPGAHLGPNGHRPSAAAPPAPAAPARPSVVAPQHNRSSIEPFGD